jgi:hypothetical protein
MWDYIQLGAMLFCLVVAGRQIHDESRTWRVWGWLSVVVMSFGVFVWFVVRFAK